MKSGYRIEPLAGHGRDAFVSGSDKLDHYFRQIVTQDIRRRVATCFIAIDIEDEIAGFYTLAATDVPLKTLNSAQIKKLPRYQSVPAILLGRLAVAKNHQEKGLGAALIVDALMRARSSGIGAHFMVVDAKDESAVRFYEHLEFERLPDEKSRLIRIL